MLALHCVTKLKAYCRLATELANDNVEKIHEFAAKHLELVKLIEMANSVFGVTNLFQLLTTLGLFVALCFQMRYGIDYINVIIIPAAAVQLFFYCFLSECVYTWVR